MCDSPLTGFWTGLYTSNGKRDIVIVPEHRDHLPVALLRRDFARTGKHLGVRNGHLSLVERVLIPCGKCISCRLKKSRDWSVRLMCEKRVTPRKSYFLTLTYDDEHLESCSLIPEHLTKFMKDLRRHFEYHHEENGIRFFACGEYGEKYHRPHFHVILFNCNIRDLKLRSEYNNIRLFESPSLSKIWNRGFVAIGEVTVQSCQYVARYTTKKMFKRADDYEEAGIKPEFIRMSRMPGIGREYYDQNKDHIYDVDGIEFSDYLGRVKKYRPSKYFDDLMAIENPDVFAGVKELRILAAQMSMAAAMERLGMTEEDVYTYRLEIHSKVLNKMPREPSRQRR